MSDYPSISSDTTKPQNRWRWLPRFGLKTLLALMLFLAIALTLGTKCRNVIERQNTLESLSAMGADITLEAGWSDENLS